MIITSDPGSLAAPTPGSSGTNVLADAKVFLELLMTQLQNQDPLNPMDNAEFTQQLAALSSVEQLQSANSNLETLLQYQSSINNAQSVSLIGKEVKALGSKVTLDESGGAEIHFILADDAQKVKVFIKDDANNIVATIEAGDMEEGEASVTWNGKTKDGLRASAGEYNFEVEAKDAEGNDVNADRLIRGVVLGVKFENGTPYLMIGDTRVTLGDIFEVCLDDQGGTTDETDDDGSGITDVY